MLGHLISKAPHLIRPYLEPIIQVLIPKLKETDSSIGVTISILTAIGDLAQVGSFETVY
jgi:serine/threonine-protein kinase mTOR